MLFRSTPAAGKHLRIAIFGHRQLCSDCLHHLFERQLAACEVRTVTRVEEVRAAFGDHRPPHVVVKSTICLYGLEIQPLRDICAQLAPLPVIVHVDAVDAVLTRQIMDAGAKAILPTWLPPGVAGAILQLVAAGEIYIPSLDGSPASSMDSTAPLYGVLGRLTPRQLSVLRLATAGKSNKEIGLELGLDPNTIKFHVATLMDKLGVDNRVRLAVVASRLLLP